LPSDILRVHAFFWTMSSVATSFPCADSVDIDEAPKLVAIRERLCSEPVIKVVDFADYSEQKDDAIWQATQCGGRDSSAYGRMARAVQETIPLIEEFVSRRGTFVVAPSWDDIRAGAQFALHIRPDDYIIPVCHEGMNRSQIMHLAAKIIKSRDMFPTDAANGAYGVSLPHGAISGFDPHSAFSNLTADNYIEYLHGVIPKLAQAHEKGDWLHEAFFDAFGVEKAPRIGQDVCEVHGRMLNPSEEHADFAKLAADRTAQRRNMNSLLFRPSTLKLEHGPTGRAIVMAFDRAAAVFIRRMMEVAGEEDFSNIIVVCLPFPDTISRAGGLDQRQAYFAATGNDVTRHQMAVWHHVEVLEIYARMLTLVIKGTWL